MGLHWGRGGGHDKGRLQRENKVAVRAWSSRRRGDSAISESPPVPRAGDDSWRAGDWLPPRPPIGRWAVPRRAGLQARRDSLIALRQAHRQASRASRAPGGRPDTTAARQQRGVKLGYRHGS